MCVYTERRSRASVAHKDIHVFKVLSWDNKSLHQKFQYTPNTTYDLDRSLIVKADPNRLVPNDWGIVSEGFHAFFSLKLAVSMAEYYSYKLRLNCKVVQFTIPEGAEFFKDDHESGAIVSDEIISGDLAHLDKSDI